MKRVGLALLLTGATPAAAASIHGPHPLAGLTGKAFDLAWVNHMLLAQETAAQADLLLIQGAEHETVKVWAARDFQARQQAVTRLQKLLDQWRLPPQPCPSCAQPISETESFASPLQLEERFLNEFPFFSRQTADLARLGLSKSQNPALKQEAKALLAWETAQMNDFRSLK